MIERGEVDAKSCSVAETSMNGGPLDSVGAKMLVAMIRMYAHLRDARRPQIVHIEIARQVARSGAGVNAAVRRRRRQPACPDVAGRVVKTEQAMHGQQAPTVVLRLRMSCAALPRRSRCSSTEACEGNMRRRQCGNPRKDRLDTAA
ncbi:hypothetical protein BV20DRAFT_975781 [Pilatotrama ljubarskyi]|nr:hypothetical protein BV20DRAFT_975781 [Pilatotrama ljubarskyi]